MREPWDESGDGSAVELAFDGFDAAKRDAEEAREFVSTVTRQQGVNVWLMGRWIPARPTVVLLVVLGALVGYGAVRLVASMPSVFGADVTLTSYAGLLLLSFLSPFFVGGLIAALRRPRPRLESGRFTLRLDSAGICVTGAASGPRTLPLAAIDHFEGGARVTVVKTDGTREALSCSLIAASRHAELAARLDEVLRSVRASAAGYRGVRVAQEDEVPIAEQADGENVQEEEPARFRGE